MATKIQLRRDTAANWSSNNPVLSAGEIGIETDTLKFKIGNGSAWNSISSYANVTPSGLDNSLGDYIPIAEKGASGGVAELNANGYLIIPGSDADSYELTLSIPTITSDRTISFPNASGTVALTSDITSAVSSLVDGAPGLLDTLNELAAAINDDPTFFTSVATNLSNHESDTTNIHGIANTAKLITDDGNQVLTNKTINGTNNNITHIQNSSLDNHSITINGYEIQLGGSASYGTDNISEGTSNLYFTNERAQDAVATALANGTHTNITVSYNDNANSISLTGAQTYSDENAQDAIGNNLGTGLSYNDSTGSISVDTNTIQARVSGVSDTEIGYLDGVSSSIQTQLDGKALSSHSHTTSDITGLTASATELNVLDGISASTTELNYVDGVTSSIQTQLDGKSATGHTHSSTNVTDFTEAAQDAIGNSLGSGLSYNDGTGAISVDTAIIQARVADVSDTEIGYLNGVTSAIQTQIDGKLNLSGGTLTGALTLSGDPVNDLHPATKQYVDAMTTGLNVHNSVKAATTANINISADLENNDYIDNVLLTTGDRVLVKNQTTKSDNGIYEVQASGAAIRTTDYNSVGEVDAGDFIFVEYGDTNGKTGWVQTNHITTLGTDNIEFTQFSGVGTYTAGTGLSLSGTQFRIDTTTTVDTSTAQTLTNKTINGSNNTISNIGNSSLTNSSITINGSSVSLGGTRTLGTDDISEGASPTNKWFTDGRARDAIGNNLGTGLSYNPVQGVISVDTTAIQSTVSGVSNTEIGYLDGVNSPIQTQIDGKISASSSDTLTNKTINGSNNTISNISLTSSVTGKLPIANGGTGASTAQNARNALLPTQSSNSGKYLTTDGTDVSWATVDALPTQSGNAGKILYTSGTAASWKSPFTAVASSNPNSPSDGDIYFNYSDLTLNVAYGGVWFTMGQAQFAGGEPGTVSFSQTYDGGSPSTVNFDATIDAGALS